MTTISKILIIPLCLFFNSCSFSSENKQDLKKINDLKSIKLKSDRDAVESLLKLHNVEYSWSEEENKIYAIVRDIKKTFFVSENMTFIYFFKNNQLQKIESKQVNTGP